ncbi:MAG: F420-dependent NADP oxidoreductase [Bacteroidales bacterium]|nr:F420-dependent NADP oxidoreductase [Bacteroidales bacterium]MDT8372512.1 F420-dependent NADP oxidoreductase [Bacteroidales bacterium]
MATYNISFIGAGNVASSLCAGLAAAGHRIVSVASKSGDSAGELAAVTGAQHRTDLSVPDNCDILFLAVTDSAIAEVAARVVIPARTLLLHTAGSVSLAALGRDRNAGVFYPLQTFTRGFSPDLGKVPFFIEATDSDAMGVIRELGKSVGAGSWECDSLQRSKLHVAAVFTNNFSNFMMTTGEVIAAEAGFDPSLLKPLAEETMRKVLRMGPVMAQTGPAKRDDEGTVKSHIDLLSFSPEHQELYRLISSMISGHYIKGMK